MAKPKIGCIMRGGFPEIAAMQSLYILLKWLKGEGLPYPHHFGGLSMGSYIATIGAMGTLSHVARGVEVMFNLSPGKISKYSPWLKIFLGALGMSFLTPLLPTHTRTGKGLATAGALTLGVAALYGAYKAPSLRSNKPLLQLLEDTMDTEAILIGKYRKELDIAVFDKNRNETMLCVNYDPPEETGHCFGEPYEFFRMRTNNDVLVSLLGSGAVPGFIKSVTVNDKKTGDGGIDPLATLILFTNAIRRGCNILLVFLETSEIKSEEGNADTALKNTVRYFEIMATLAMYSSIDRGICAVKDAGISNEITQALIKMSSVLTNQKLKKKFPHTHDAVETGIDTIYRLLQTYSFGELPPVEVVMVDSGITDYPPCSFKSFTQEDLNEFKNMGSLAARRAIPKLAEAVKKVALL
ncbi:MAG: hypothetical protein A3B17_00820 [Candidatus Yanofskybacteria bacterium RIFCSPLOWO2_01_FULL_45_72]|uniref:PNPLA domain-containing protein n=3 Tax=Candidatus Yanofskyibacteriota TaxID=1752733 RepID=A0A1F8H6I2_9BACT|nr:MAG: hypothetical protein A3B17_00820 [Candidatus Yanofskybacteria bacterium RIFCSPLOWO2_01_FULL_45_72]OGN32638.1 MAG: hypothetical protein A3J01_01605 [Candidatus Yanofskybacteria bacterium RIFCSPLOWO2_02_FULL_45_18]